MRTVARKPDRQPSFADRIIAADERFMRFLLEHEDEASLLPTGAVVIFRDDDDPALFQEAGSLALTIHAKIRSSKERSRPPVIVDVTTPSISLKPTSWEGLAEDVGNARS